MNHQASHTDTELIQHAAALMARMLADDVSAEDQQAVLQWRTADERHEAVWQKLLQVSHKFSTLPDNVGSRALLRQPGVGRRQLLQWVGMGGVLATSAWYSTEKRLVQSYLADYGTAVGEMRELRLLDGSQLHLNTRTAVDIHFDAQQRKLVLHEGELAISTGHDFPAGQTRSPFFVDTRFGRIIALGTRFIVRQLDDRIRVTVEEGTVEVQPIRSGVVRQIGAGDQIEFGMDSIGQPLPVATTVASWRNGLLVAAHLRLADFAAEIARYRPGVVRCHPRVADLQISGVFSLKDTDRALANVVASLPVTVQYRTRYWVTLMPPPAAT